MSDNYTNIVEAVKKYIQDNHGRRPTIPEIGEMVGIRSTSHILYHLMAAVEKGDLIEEGEPRTSRRYATKIEEE